MHLTRFLGLLPVVAALTCLPGRFSLAGDEDATASEDRNAPGTKTFFDKPSPYGRITVRGRDQQYYTLRINERILCIAGKKLKTEALIGAIAADNMPQDGKGLNIGLGCGETAYTMLNHPNTGKLDIAEINPVVKQAYAKVFEDRFQLLANEAADMYIADGAHILRTGVLDGKDVEYDSIVIDIEAPNVIYSSPIYTLEYFRHAKARLVTGGVFALWTFNANPAYMKVIYNTLQRVFDTVEIIVPAHDNRYGIFLAGNKDLAITPLANRDKEAMSQIQNHPEDSVNTIENPAAQQYFDVDKVYDYIDEINKEHFIETSQ